MNMGFPKLRGREPVGEDLEKIGADSKGSFCQYNRIV